MSVYLQDIPLTTAINRLQEALEENNAWNMLEGEIVPLDESAIGRVIADTCWASISSPHYHASAMDGFVVRSKDTIGALLTTPIKLYVLDVKHTGENFEHKSLYLNTGDPLPEWADAVIPIENVEQINENGSTASDLRKPFAIYIRQAVSPWQHVRPMGEDIIATQLVLPIGHTLRPIDLGALAASGHDSIPVVRQPRVAIIPTGTELVPVGTPPEPGEIIEFNSLVLAAQIQEWGGIPDRFPIISDNFSEIAKCVKGAARTYDLVLLLAGSSAGSEDFSASVVASLGTLLVHGVAVRPGHPVILGMIESSKSKEVSNIRVKKQTPIIGVPGYPVSAALTNEIFIEPILSRWLGQNPSEREEIDAQITRKITSSAGDDDYIRVAVGKVGNKMVAAPLSRGAGVITSLARADGIVIVPRGSQGLPAGEEVKVKLYKQLADLERTIFIIGSHDLTIDLIAQYLSVEDRRIASAHVGSLAGLVALRRGEAHIAGSHLLDPVSGEYNISYVRKYLSGIPTKVISFVTRQQGLIVANGNPKMIFSLQDLIRQEVRFINRQKGAGTRLLLDYHLKQDHIVPEFISGYNREEFTHLSIAAAIASGRADCGLGIAAAANALDLDFMPLFIEKYELIIPREYFGGELLRPLHALIKNELFRKNVASIPGYDIEGMGDIVAEIG